MNTIMPDDHATETLIMSAQFKKFCQQFRVQNLIVWFVTTAKMVKQKG